MNYDPLYNPEPMFRAWFYEKSQGANVRGYEMFGFDVHMGAGVPLWVEFEGTAKVICIVHNAAVQRLRNAASFLFNMNITHCPTEGDMAALQRMTAGILNQEASRPPAAGSVPDGSDSDAASR